MTRRNVQRRSTFVILDPARDLKSSDYIYRRIETTRHVQRSIARHIVDSRDFLRMRFRPSDNIFPGPILDHAKDGS